MADSLENFLMISISSSTPLFVTHNKKPTASGWDNRDDAMTNPWMRFLLMNSFFFFSSFFFRLRNFRHFIWIRIDIQCEVGRDTQDTKGCNSDKTPISGDDWHQVTTTGSAFSALHMTISAHKKKCFHPLFFIFCFICRNRAGWITIFHRSANNWSGKKKERPADLSFFHRSEDSLTNSCSQEDCWVVFIDRRWRVAAVLYSNNKKSGEKK